jgi:O-antigen/teichoic acid export membrane protein
VLAIAYLLFGFGHRFIPASLGWRVLFIAAVVLWTIFALQDSVLIGLRASPIVAVENIAYSFAKLALLPAFVILSASQGIFVASTAPLIPTVAAVTWYLFRKRIPDHMAVDGPAETLPSTRELIVLAGAQYTALLSGVFLPSLFSIIVIERLGPVANAHFFLPNMIVTSLGIFAWSISRSFLVEASHEPSELRRHANSAIRALLIVLLPSIVLGCIFAPQFLGLFGPSYAAHGTALLRMLLVSLFGTAVMVFYSTFAWLDKRVWWMTARNLAGSLVQLMVVILLIGHFGIDSIGIAALANASISFSIFLPISIRRYRLTAVAAPGVDDESPVGDV